MTEEIDMRLLLAISLATVAAGLSLGTAFATDALVKNHATLRENPSTQNPPIAVLKQGEDVELIEPTPKDGYYHVRTREGEEGYIYARNLEIVTAAPVLARPALAVPRAAARPANLTGVVSSIPTDWEKPDPNVTTYHGPDGDCGPTGSSGSARPVDTLTNARKNRTDAASEYHPVTWAALQALPYPRPAPTSLMDWTPDQRAIIQPYQGIAVSVVGFLAAVKVEDRGSGESTNCHFANAVEVDWHMPLVEQSGDAEATAIVVETTPRVRQFHAKWTPTALVPWVKSSASVRISGWVLLDPDHPGHLGKFRSTLYEVHPVMGIEVLQDGQWVSLDDL